MKYILLLLVLFSFSSCKSQNSKIELELKDCINEAVNTKIKENYGKSPFDFYVFILKIEEKLLSNNLIEGNDRKNYLNLFQRIKSVKDARLSKMYNQQNNIIDKFGFGFNLFTINDAIFNQCPYKVSVNLKEGEGKFIYTQGELLNRIMSEGFSNDKLIEELINGMSENDFKKVVYRAPIVLLIMIQLDNKYNPAYEKFKGNGSSSN